MPSDRGYPRAGQPRPPAAGDEHRYVRPDVRPLYHQDCWLAHHGHMERGDKMPPCDGSLVRVHLIPRQFLKRNHLPQLDPRTYVYACGGITGGPGGHHGMFDQGNRKLRVAFEDLPLKVKEFAEQHGLEWWLVREYLR